MRQRKKRTTAAMAAFLLAGFVPGVAEAAESPFRDVPADHWAAAAVQEVAVVHRLIPSNKDGTFRGEAILNRLDFAKTLSAFIQEIEIQAGVSLVDTSFSFYAFDDIDELPDRNVVEPIANQYNLFDGIPGIEAHRFEPRRPVTRYELAAAFDHLLRLVEKKGLITAAGRGEVNNPFIDVKPLGWAYQSVINSVVRYHILSGYPDATFRGNEEINRYQFASAASQAFSLIREQVSGEVRQRLPRGLELGNRYSKFHGEDPVLGVVEGLYAFSFPGVVGQEAINKILTQQPLRGRFGGIHVGLHTADYPVQGGTQAGETFSNSFAENSIDGFIFLNQENTPNSPFFVPAEDFGLSAALSTRMFPVVPTAEPFQFQPYYGAYLFRDIGLPARLQLGVGAGVLGGFLFYYRTPETALSLDIMLGAGPYGGLRILPKVDPIFAMYRPFVRIGLDIELFLSKSAAFNVPIGVWLLPGGLHADSVYQDRNLAMAAGGVGVGFTWR